MVLEGFLFFSLYSFSCIAKQVTTLKQLRLLSCLDFLVTNLESLAPVLILHYCCQYHLCPTPPVTLAVTRLSLGTDTILAIGRSRKVNSLVSLS
jgi:hypothetical protein